MCFEAQQYSFVAQLERLFLLGAGAVRPRLEMSCGCRTSLFRDRFALS